MAKTSFRMNSKIEVDKAKEPDLAELVKNLSEKRKLTAFITSLLRLYVENPENYPELQELESKLEMPKRQEHYESTKQQLNELKSTVDTVYDMIHDMHTLAKFGKKLGLDKSAEMSAQAEFIVRKRYENLCRVLGFDEMSGLEAQRNISDTKEQAENTLSYIINSYDNVVSEIRHSGLVVVNHALDELSHEKQKTYEDLGLDEKYKDEAQDKKLALGETKELKIEENNDLSEMSEMMGSLGF